MRECHDAYTPTHSSKQIVIREDLRPAPAFGWPPIGQKIGGVRGSHTTYFENLALHGQFTRKVASRLGGDIVKALDEMSGKANHAKGPAIMKQHARAVRQKNETMDPLRVWGIVRDPWTKLVSAYREILRHVSRCNRNPPHSPSAWICSRPWHHKGSTMGEPARFEAFFYDILFGPFNLTMKDTMSYHAWSQMMTFRGMPRLDYLLHIENLRPEFEEMLKEILPPDIRKSAAVAAMLDAYMPIHTINKSAAAYYIPPRPRHFGDGNSRNRALANIPVPSSNEIIYRQLSNQTQTRFLEYFRQDYACLGYARPP